MHDAPHLGIGIATERLEERPQGEPTRCGGGEHRTAPHVRVRIGNPPPDVGREPRRIPFQQPTERLVSRGAHARAFSVDRRQGLAQIIRRGSLWRHRRHRFQLGAQRSLAALSLGIVPFEVEDRAAQAADELGEVDRFRVAVAHSALPLDHAGEQGLAGCHQLVHASPQLRGGLFAGGEALVGRSRFPPQAHQLLCVVTGFRFEEMSLLFGAQRLGVFQSPVQGGDFLAGAGDLVLEQAHAPSLAGLTGRGLGEPNAGLIGFGARFVERAAQLLEPALEQEGPVRAGRYAFSQGKRTICHYSKTRQFAKPVAGPPSLVHGLAFVPLKKGP